MIKILRREEISLNSGELYNPTLTLGEDSGKVFYIHLENHPTIKSRDLYGSIGGRKNVEAMFKLIADDIKRGVYK